MEDLRYPIGKFEFEPTGASEEHGLWIGQIEQAPDKLRTAVRGLTQQQLDTPYRPGGWTVRQLAHHVPDSHLNAYARFKLALTEDNPTIKPYYEDRWAELPDSKAEIESSLALLELLHTRWVRLLRSIEEKDWLRTFHHPELGPVTLEKNLAHYAWHGRHHVAHITNLRNRMQWR